MEIRLDLQAKVLGPDTTPAAQARVVDEIVDLVRCILTGYVDGAEITLGEVQWTPDV